MFSYDENELVPHFQSRAVKCSGVAFYWNLPDQTAVPACIIQKTNHATDETFCQIAT